MSAVWSAVRSGWRRGAGGFVALALVLGISSAVCLAAMAGARRTHSAIDRFHAHFGSPDVGAALDAPNAGLDDATLAAFEEDPEVEAAAVITRLLFSSGDGEVLNVLTFGDTAPGVRPVRPIVVEGRFADSDEASEAMLDESAAREHGLGIGSTVTLTGFGPDQLEDIFSGEEEVTPDGPTIEVRVVGIIRSPADLSVLPPISDVVWLGSGEVWLTQAAFDEYADDVARFGPSIEVHLRGGSAAVPAFVDRIEPRLGEGAFFYFETDIRALAEEARRATNMESTSLWLLGWCAAIAVVVIAGQALARSAHAQARDSLTYRALGFRRTQLLGVGAVQGLAVGAVAAGVAVLGAIALSPLMPIGLARRAEVDLGVAVDGTVLAIGAVAVAGFAALRTVITWIGVLRAPGRAAGGGDRPSLLQRVVVSTGFAPAAASAGLALGREGPATASRAAARISTIAASAAIAAVTAALTFGTSLTTFVDDPSLQGWTWDALVGNPHSPDLTESVQSDLEAEPDVASVTGLALFEGPLGDGTALDVVGMDDATAAVPVLEGRAPQGPDEIALGGKVMRRLHLDIGDDIRLESFEGPPVTFQIVGQVLVSPYLMNTEVGLGDGGLVSDAGRRAIAPSAPVNLFIVRLEPGVDRDAVFARLRLNYPSLVLTAERPPDAVNLRRVSSLPNVLAILLGLVGAATVVHGLVSLTRRGRRELAVLRSFGFVRRQLAAAMASQGFALGAIALVVGIPIGIAIGRLGWTGVADAFAVAASPTVPPAAILVVALATVVLVTAAAVAPAVIAARTSAAALLRTE